MVFAKDEAAFNSAYLKVKCALGGQVNLLEYLEGIRNRKTSYSKYCIESYEGNRFLVGSSTSEQNHSSALNYFFNGGSVSLKRTKLSVHEYVKNLLEREELHVKLLNQYLAEANTEHICLRSAVLAAKVPQDVKDNLLLPAVEHLSVLSYKIFNKEYLQSQNYAVTKEEDGSFTVIYANSMNIEKAYVFSNDTTCRCTCVDRVSLNLMCRHEITLYKRFELSFFDTRHLFRSQSIKAMSMIDNVDEGVSIFRTDTTTKNQSDDVGENSSSRNNSIETSVGVMNIEAAAVNYTDLGYKVLQNSFNTALKYLSNHSNEVKRVVYATMEEFGRLLKPSPKGDDVSTLKNVMGNVLQTLSSTKLNSIGGKVMSLIASKAVNRLKPTTEVSRLPLSQPRAHSTCSFCGSPTHRSNRCDVRTSLGVCFNYGNFLKYVMFDSPYTMITGIEEIHHSWPEGTYYVCLLGVFVKNIPTNMRFEMNQTVLLLKCLNRQGLEITISYFDGASVDAKMRTISDRDIFCDNTNNVGDKWFQR